MIFNPLSSQQTIELSPLVLKFILSLPFVSVGSCLSSLEREKCTQDFFKQSIHKERRNELKEYLIFSPHSSSVSKCRVLLRKKFKEQRGEK